MKKSRGSSARGARAGKSEKGMKSKKINFSDIPELSDKQLSSMRRVGRPTVGDEQGSSSQFASIPKSQDGYGGLPRKKDCLTSRSSMKFWPRNAEGELGNAQRLSLSLSRARNNRPAFQKPKVKQFRQV